MSLCFRTGVKWNRWQHCVCPGKHSHLSEECIDEEEIWLLVLLATP